MQHVKLCSDRKSTACPYIWTVSLLHESVISFLKQLRLAHNHFLFCSSNPLTGVHLMEFLFFR